MRWVIGAALVALAAAPVSAQKLSKADRETMLLTPEQIANRVEIRGADVLDPVLWISTRPVLEHRYGSDKFLRAAIDKVKGQVTYQFYVVIHGTDPFRPSSMTYLSHGSLARVEMQRLDYDPNCSRYGCSSTEQAVADISRSDMEQFAACAAPGTASSFSVKIFGSSVEGMETKMLCTEAAGLLLAVDTYQNARNAVPSK